MKALEVKNVSKIFLDKTKALEDISFSIEQGEFCVIAGSNGSGKSVLMSLIAGLDDPTSGTIDLFGNSAGLVFQDADSQILGETPEEDVSFGAKNYGLKKDELKQCVESSLEQVGLSEADIPALCEFAHATNEWKQGNPEPFTDEKFAAAIKAANAYGQTL